MTLDGTKVVVVGGSSGIGRAVAAAALARGAGVVLVGRSPERLAEAQEALGGGARAQAVSADVTREADVVRLFAEVGRFDHLVVTSVSAAYAPIASFDLDVARGVIESKLVAAIGLAKHAHGGIAERGSITFTSGIAKDRPMRRGSVIAAVNGALGALARALAIEMAPRRVNVVSPGWVDTPIWEQLAGDGKAALWAETAARLPVGRIGTTTDLAHAYVFLMVNGFTTGTTVHVDGGHTFA